MLAPDRAISGAAAVRVSSSLRVKPSDPGLAQLLVSRQVLARGVRRSKAYAMRFFRKSPPPRPTMQHRVPRPWDPPESELPAIVPIETLPFDRSEQAAIAIIGISAYTQGFEIFMIRHIRPDLPGLDQDPTPEMVRHRHTEQLSFFSLLLSDGTKVVSGRSSGDSDPPGPILRPRGGGGSAHSQFLRWWAWPLPPKGPLEFVCQWPMYGIAETRVGIDAQLILDAAQRSIQLWPADEGGGHGPRPV
jgi:hypothetical protein